MQGRIRNVAAWLFMRDTVTVSGLFSFHRFAHNRTNTRGTFDAHLASGALPTLCCTARAVRVCTLQIDGCP